MQNIFLIGFMGTGKSTVAEYLGEHFDMQVLEMDETISDRENMSITDIFEKKGEEYFRNLETSLLKEVGVNGNTVVSCGGGTPMREENVEEMKKNGKIVLLTATPETIYNRVKNSHNRPLLENNMNVEYISELLGKRQEKYQAAADIVVETDEKSKDIIANEIIHILAKMV